MPRLTFGIRWVVYGPENGYNLPYHRLLKVKLLVGFP